MKIKTILENVGEFRKNPSEEAVMDKETLMNMKEQTVPDWEMLDHRILTAKYFAKNHRHAVEFVDFINRVSEYLDHFAEVVQDVAEVTVKTTTSDTNSLTILDFALAKAVDEYAQKNNIQQERIQGNFESLVKEKKDVDDEDDRADDYMKGFDQQTTKALIQLKTKYPNAPNELAALLKHLTTVSKRSDSEDSEHDEKLLDLEKRIDELELLIKLMDNESN